MPGSSPEENSAEAADLEANAADANTVESSTTDPQGEKGDLLSAVKAALEPKEESSNSTSEGSQPEKREGDAAQQDDAANPDDDSGGFTAEELSTLRRLKPRTAERIDQLLTSRGELKAKLAELEPKLAQLEPRLAELEPKAQQFDQMVTFVENAGLSTDEVNKLFDVGAALKRDPLKAFEFIEPIFRQLEQIVGVVLPADLKQAVAIGEITEARAQELAKARSAQAVHENVRRQDEQRAQQQRQREAQETHVRTVADAVSKWGDERAKSDPDWKLKSDRIQELIELEVLRKRQVDPNYFPATAAEGIELAEKALKQADEEVKRYAPRRREVKPPTDVSSSRATAKPRSMLEAARAGLAAAR